MDVLLLNKFFEKSSIFGGKNEKNHFRGRTYCFEGGWRLATKINITFFVGTEILNIFHLTIFSEKNIFSRITAKNNFWVKKQKSRVYIMQKTGFLASFNSFAPFHNWVEV